MITVAVYAYMPHTDAVSRNEFWVQCTHMIELLVGEHVLVLRLSPSDIIENATLQAYS